MVCGAGDKDNKVFFAFLDELGHFERVWKPLIGGFSNTKFLCKCNEVEGTGRDFITQILDPLKCLNFLTSYLKFSQCDPTFALTY